MPRLVCTRVACLRLPWFQIDVLLRAGLLKRKRPTALIKGQGSTAQLVLVDPAARALGLKSGMRPSRARALVAHLQLLPWDTHAESLSEQANDALGKCLRTLSPRISLVTLGQWWMEPASPTPHEEHSLSALEANFAKRVLKAMNALGFLGAKIAIADTPICATAATYDGGHALVRVPPGEDRLYLAKLPIDALPLSSRALRFLKELGLNSIAHLQRMSPQALEARLGPEGRRAWALSQGEDMRRPLTPLPEIPSRILLSLNEGVRGVEPLLFILRPALEELIEAQARQGHALAHVGLTLEHAWGAPHHVSLTPSRAISDPRIMMELLRLRLTESLQGEGNRGPAITLTLEALKLSPRFARQCDLFQQSEVSELQAQKTLVRLHARLGKEAITRPLMRDEQKPEGAGSWVPLTDSEKKKPIITSKHMPPACLRLLPEPRSLGMKKERPDQLFFFGRQLNVSNWHGPERLSGHWWHDFYDRDYYWINTKEGFAFWVFRARSSGRWFLHGWLD